MATLRGFLGSKGRFVGVLGLPPQKEMPIILIYPSVHRRARRLLQYLPPMERGTTSQIRSILQVVT